MDWYSFNTDFICVQELFLDFFRGMDSRIFLPNFSACHGRMTDRCLLLDDGATSPFAHRPTQNIDHFAEVLSCSQVTSGFGGLKLVVPFHFVRESFQR